MKHIFIAFALLVSANSFALNGNTKVDVNAPKADGELPKKSGCECPDGGCFLPPECDNGPRAAEGLSTPALGNGGKAPAALGSK